MSDEPTMSDALRALARAGTANGPAVEYLKSRWQDGAGSLTPERLAMDPALQIDEWRSYIRSSGSINGALAKYHRTRRQMTIRQDRIKEPPKPATPSLLSTWMTEEEMRREALTGSRRPR